MDELNDLLTNGGWAEAWMREADPDGFSKLQTQQQRGIITGIEFVTKVYFAWNDAGRQKSTHQLAVEATL